MSDVRISGFSFVRNADRLYYPVRESILSILSVCDEFMIAVGKGDPGDRTREIISGIGDPRIRIIDTEWTDRDRLGGLIYSQQTNIALRACTGDWCFYIQADEVMHERYLPAVKTACDAYISRTDVDGLVFGYRHFWGDYDHHQVSHRWYPAEIRVVRNDARIESVGDAQSFRKAGEKLKSVRIGAEIYHYGYVRPPDLMIRRNREVETTYHGEQEALRRVAPDLKPFDYGPLDRLPRFTGTHPAVMREWIARMDWQDQLQMSGKMKTIHHHDKLKYRIVTWIEQNVMGGRRLGGARNYRLLKSY